LKIELNEEKTLIISAIKSRADFLGAKIRTSTSRTGDTKLLRLKSNLNNRVIKRRMYSQKTLLLVPLEKVTKKLESHSICKIKNFLNREVILT